MPVRQPRSDIRRVTRALFVTALVIPTLAHGGPALGDLLGRARSTHLSSTIETSRQRLFVDEVRETMPALASTVSDAELVALAEAVCARVRAGRGAPGGIRAATVAAPRVETRRAARLGRMARRTCVSGSHDLP